MPLPTLTYNDWRFKVNQDLNTLGSALADYRRLIFAIKTSLVTASGWTDSAGAGASVTAPWVVVASSDGTTASTSDLWLSTANLIFAVDGLPHSWIVLRQTGINGQNYEVCIELAHSTTNLITQSVSFSSGFDLSSLTVSNKPTATDEKVMLTDRQWFLTNVAFSCSLHVFMTNDGECTRIVACNANVVKAIWQFEKPANTATGWTYPSVAYLATEGPVTYTHCDNAWTIVWEDALSMPLGVYQSTEMYAGGYLISRLTVANELSSEWPILPIRFYSNVYPFGFKGELSDVWWGATTIVDGDTYPASGTLNQFIQFGDQVHPWNQSTPLMT